MLPISNKIYFRTLQILVVGLSLLLIYQTFFNVTKNKEINVVTVSDNTVDNKETQKAKSIQNAIETIASFSEAEMESPAILPVGRNLFQHSSFERVSSQEIVPNREITSARAKTNDVLALTQISELIPNKVYIQNKAVKFLIKGTNLNESMKAYVGNNLLETNFIDSSQLQVILPAQFLATEGVLQIEVKTQKTDKEIGSNRVFLTVAKPPIPSFTFVGMFSDTGGHNTKLLLRVGTEDLTVSIGDLIKNRWKLANLSGDFLTFEDRETGISYQVKKGERIVSQPVLAQDKEYKQDKVVANETSKRSDIIETNLFERSSKPMTSKELWEKRAAMTREKKN